MKNSTYAVAFLLRKTGMTLTEIRSLELPQLRELFAEVFYQDSVAEYQAANIAASIMATITNTVPRKGGGSVKASDFLVMECPRRTGSDAQPSPEEELRAMANKFNIKLPPREMKDLGG